MSFNDPDCVNDFVHLLSQAHSIIHSSA